MVGVVVAIRRMGGAVRVLGAVRAVGVVGVVWVVRVWGGPRTHWQPLNTL